MSIGTELRTCGPRSGGLRLLRHLRPDPALWAGLAVAGALTLPKAAQVASTGIFLNPDDAMRAVEVRDYLAGQGWFDLVQHRMSPNHPFLMHWSRLVDLPLALITRLFELVLPADRAELAMRLAVPSLLFLGALWIMLDLVRDLIGPKARLPAALLLAGAVEFVGNFIPGHIHHHAVQATLLLGAAKAVLDALRSKQAWPAMLAGALTALSLGIGLQSLPFFLVIMAALPAAWMFNGEAFRRALAGFGASVAVGGSAVFLLDVPPSLYGAGACDAFSTAHLLVLSVSGLMFLALAAATGRLGGWIARFGAASAAAASVFGAVAWFYPACLHDPMAGVDPLLRSQWLDQVGEALPLVRLIHLAPADGLALALTLVVGFSATAFATVKADGTRRPAWLVLLALSAIGVCGTLYQVRVAASASAFLVPGAAWVVLAIFERIAREPKRPALLIAVLAGLTLSGAGISAATSGVVHLLPVRAPSIAGTPVGAGGAPEACFEPELYSRLAVLPPGLVLSTIDPGSTILASTPHSVLAAPYHRNTYGIRLALLALNAPPAEAEPLIAESKADYLVLCRASNETADTVRQHPDSLSAAVLAGHPPRWLEPIESTGPLVIYRVLRARG